MTNRCSEAGKLDQTEMKWNERTVPYLYNTETSKLTTLNEFITVIELIFSVCEIE